MLLAREFIACQSNIDFLSFYEKAVLTQKENYVFFLISTQYLVILQDKGTLSEKMAP